MAVQQQAGKSGLHSLEDIKTVPVADLTAATQVRGGGGGSVEWERGGRQTWFSNMGSGTCPARWQGFHT
jgi:hypothetical protein